MPDGLTSGVIQHGIEGMEEPRSSTTAPSSATTCPVWVSTISTLPEPARTSTLVPIRAIGTE